PAAGPCWRGGWPSWPPAGRTASSPCPSSGAATAWPTRSSSSGRAAPTASTTASATDAPPTPGRSSGSRPDDHRIRRSGGAICRRGRLHTMEHTQTSRERRSSVASPDGVEVHGPARDRYRDVLSDDALGLVAELQRELGPTREDLLARRGERQTAFDAGELPDFLPGAASVREGDWRVAPVEGLADRRVEITGPTDRKMLINALNSGARVFMADFEDANAPT